MQEASKCLICDVSTSSVHMGIDSCRACAIFYRRARARNKKFLCRAGTGNCEISRGTAMCKLCRYNKFRKIYEVCHVQSGDDQESGMATTSSDSNDLKEPSPPSIECFPENFDVKPQSESLIEKIREAYNVLSSTRISMEMEQRASEEPAHPSLSFYDGNLEITTVSYKSIDHSIKCLNHALFRFAASVFDDFRTLEMLEKFRLVRHFQCLFEHFESNHRMSKLLPDNYDANFLGYIRYLTFDSFRGFFNDSPMKSNAHAEREAIRTLHECRKQEKLVRDDCIRLRLSEEEFSCLLGLLFCSLDGMVSSERLIHMCDRYRKQLLDELHQLYKRQEGPTGYAWRLGELFSLLVKLKECASKSPENLELLRLLDIIDADSYAYQMLKS